jgi:hypothetical protein
LSLARVFTLLGLTRFFNFYFAKTRGCILLNLREVKSTDTLFSILQVLLSGKDVKKGKKRIIVFRKNIIYVNYAILINF